EVGKTRVPSPDQNRAIRLFLKSEGRMTFNLADDSRGAAKTDNGVGEAAALTARIAVNHQLRLAIAIDIRAGDLVDSKRPISRSGCHSAFYGSDSSAAAVGRSFSAGEQAKSKSGEA